MPDGKTCIPRFVSTENNYMYVLHVCYVNYMYTTCMLPGGASTKSDYGCTYY